jgi:DNA-binding transcriptional ArsR family regulator
MKLRRETADVWASWFRALGDPTRVLMLHLLASVKRPLTIGEMVDALDVGQSTVSHHCRILEDVGFVICEQEGTSTKCQINKHCLEMFPSAADVIMGRAPTDDDLTGCAPWMASERELRHLRRPARRGTLAGRDTR